jgi:transglutaminase-like putative cysteine protease
MTFDRQLVRNEPVNEVLTYDAVSFLRTRSAGPLSTTGRRYESELPAGRNPRSLALARELRARASDDADFARLTLDWFRDNGLEYTLEPDATGLDSVDSVLFDTKRGFCGRFASAYATLMRAAGVPSRIVTGYLGGEWNPIGEYLIVRQSDAHAWTEIWLEGQGWTRIDPTAVVAPERLRSSLYEVLATESEPLGVAWRRYEWLAQLTRLWDGTNQWWREQVLDFDLGSQLAFLRKLGIEAPGWQHLGWGFAGALVTWLAWVAATFRRSVARARPDRIGRAWLKATRKLQRVAARESHEGALDYARRVSLTRPALGPQVTALAQRYTALRFGPDPRVEDIAALERDIKALVV